ncbi:elongation factor P [Buchnera aphidicola]|uniref:elongation factor P n=1 Tax=Buchnera aphidicola TaxID=9 RepID=UPI00209354C0|nr:elongation factor P [Buchnera aphidicola]USS94154.1 elongation factor P [Buchnera aphidicola (Sipha maydis)]WII23702.1 elongation factor P [Buchnera aphidicola (Sipha maydis)]
MSNNYSIHSLKPGLKVIIFKEPCIIKSSFFVKPGKGQAFTRVKFKSFLSGKTVELNFKATDRLKKANIKEIDSIYLYNDNSFWYFLDNSTFEEIHVIKEIIDFKRFWLIPQCQCSLTVWKKNVISVNVNNFINLKVIQTSPVIKKNSINNSLKMAILETGVSIKVPYFIKINDYIKVDTRKCKYISRVK